MLAAKMSDQRVPSGVITNGGDGQDARAERSEVVGGVGSAARNDVRFAMLEDQDRRLARDAGDFTVLEFIGNKIAQENDCFRIELLDALTEGEKVDGG